MKVRGITTATNADTVTELQEGFLEAAVDQMFEENDFPQEIIDRAIALQIEYWEKSPTGFTVQGVR